MERYLKRGIRSRSSATISRLRNITQSRNFQVISLFHLNRKGSVFNFSFLCSCFFPAWWMRIFSIRRYFQIKRGRLDVPAFLSGCSDRNFLKYLDTVVSETSSSPIVKSFEYVRGAPQLFSPSMRQMRSRISILALLALMQFRMKDQPVNLGFIFFGFGACKLLSNGSKLVLLSLKSQKGKKIVVFFTKSS